MGAGPPPPFAIIDRKGALSPRHFTFMYWNRVMVNLHCQDVPRIGLKELPYVVHSPTATRTSLEDLMTFQSHENEGWGQEMSEASRETGLRRDVSVTLRVKRRVGKGGPRSAVLRRGVFVGIQLNLSSLLPSLPLQGVCQDRSRHPAPGPDHPLSKSACPETTAPKATSAASIPLPGSGMC